VTVRRARTADVGAIRDLVEPLAARRVLVRKDAVAYY
jgi:amino-acid N-acetyltransferase